MKKVYIDTTLPSYYYEERDSIDLKFKHLKTVEWWDNEKNKYKIYSSQVTLDELSAGNYPNKKKIIELSTEIPILSYNDEIERIVKIYIKNYLVPIKDIRDGLHLAYTSFHEIDYLLTWNCSHLANVNKIEHIKKIHNKYHLFTPIIITPLELFNEEEQ